MTFQRLGVIALVGLMISLTGACGGDESVSSTESPETIPSTGSPISGSTDASSPTFEVANSPDLTIAPTPLFGLFDDSQSFAADADLDAAVRALRVQFPEIGGAPVAVPSGIPAGATVRFVGWMTWDGHPSVHTGVELDGRQLVHIEVLPDDGPVCFAQGVEWTRRTVRDDRDACEYTPPNAVAFYEWREAASGWQATAIQPDISIALTLIEGLHILD